MSFVIEHPDGTYTEKEYAPATPTVMPKSTCGQLLASLALPTGIVEETLDVGE
jgi:hypothetical protein